MFAGGEPRVESETIRQHTKSRLCVLRSDDGIDVIHVHSPLSGFITAYSILSVVVFPAPFGPSRPVIAPSCATKLTPSTAVTLRIFCARLVDLGSSGDAVALRGIGPGRRHEERRAAN